MDDWGLVLLFVLFLVLPALEGILKRRGGSETGPPGGADPRRRGTGGRLPVDRPPRGLESASERGGAPLGTERPLDVAPRDATRRTGGAGVRARHRVDLGGGVDVTVPDDVWAVLTEERPPWAPEDPAVEEGWVRGRAEAEPPPPITLETPAPTEARSLEQIVALEERVAVSLEQEPLPAETRHARFHEELERLRLRRERAHPRGRRLRRDLGLETAGDLKRAVVLREILGPPKGLSDF